MKAELMPRTVALDPWKAAQAFKASGMFPDLQSEAQAYVKILAGDELGIPPMAAMGGINVIQGKATLSANLLATLVKRHPAYDYKVIAHDTKVCRIEFTQNGEVSGVSEFSADDAKRAGLSGKNWSNYPQAMMFARALTQGVRWHCPDVTAGSAAYTPEELGAVDEIDPRPIDTLAELMAENGFSAEDKAGIKSWLTAEPDLKEVRINDAIGLLENGEADAVRICAGFDAEPVTGEVVE
jgi:hypothetical protein